MKRFDQDRCDQLFVAVSDGRCWLIPSAAVDGSISISLGGDKYSEYLLEAAGETRLSALQSDARGSAGDGEPGSAVNRVPSAKRVRIPPPPSAGAAARGTGVTRISRSHQLTIPVAPFNAAGLAVGDRIGVAATGGDA